MSQKCISLTYGTLQFSLIYGKHVQNISISLYLGKVI